jgi:hypothetical protein
MTRTEASVAAASVAACDGFGSGDGNNNNYSPSTSGGIVLNQRRRGSLESPVRSRERKPSETIPVDLSRVVEESEEPVNGGGRGNGMAHKAERINLKQGKWPDDFLDAFSAAQNHVASRPIAIKKPSRSSLATAMSADAPTIGHDELATADLVALSAPADPPSTLESQYFSSPAARRPSHRARHSVDTPVLPSRDFLLPRDSSPDAAAFGSGFAASSRVALRRSSTRGGIAGQRNGVYVPRRSSPDDAASRGGGDNDPFVAVPFPRAVSGPGDHVPSLISLNAPPSLLSDSIERTSSHERSIGPSTGSGSAATLGIDGGGSTQAPPPRGRFQSEVDGASSRRRPRPNSYDEFGAKPRRSRFESMVNLGVASGVHASASDLMARDATEGSMSRQTLVVREEGKAADALCECFYFLLFFWGGRREAAAWLICLLAFYSNLAIASDGDNSGPSIERLT